VLRLFFSLDILIKTKQMSSIPLYHCQINTDNVTLIGNLLEKENFLRQTTLSTFIKSNLDYNIQVNLSQSFESPSIICCCSTIPISLLQLLSCLNTNSNSRIILILFIQYSDIIDWNPLINLITTYNLSLNIFNNENDFSQKLYDIINNLAKQNITKKIISINDKKDSSTTSTQVEQFAFSILLYCKHFS
jgi:hypothetical protein